GIDGPEDEHRVAQLQTAVADERRQGRGPAPPAGELDLVAERLAHVRRGGRDRTARGGESGDAERGDRDDGGHERDERREPRELPALAHLRSTSQKTPSSSIHAIPSRTGRRYTR